VSLGIPQVLLESLFTTEGSIASPTAEEWSVHKRVQQIMFQSLFTTESAVVSFMVE
jgi:hypothetical protein